MQAPRQPTPPPLRRVVAVIALVLWMATAATGIRAMKGLRPLGAPKRGGGWADVVDSASGPGGNPMSYHGGPVIVGPAHVYFIWYGNWTGHPAVGILTDLVTALPSSSYLDILTTYTDGGGVRLANTLTLAGNVTVGYSHGKSLTDDDVAAIVGDAVTTGSLPVDPSGIYVVFTSAGVGVTSAVLGALCEGFCGYHSAGYFPGALLTYALVPDASRACTRYTCSYQLGLSPNNSPTADGMASVLVHELAEALTDEYGSAWYAVTPSGQTEEMADLCAWTFGATYASGNGAVANVALGGRDFLLQQLWVNDGDGYCGLNFTASALSPSQSVTRTGTASQSSARTASRSRTATASRSASVTQSRSRSRSTTRSESPSPSRSQSRATPSLAPSVVAATALVTGTARPQHGPSGTVTRSPVSPSPTRSQSPSLSRSVTVTPLQTPSPSLSLASRCVVFAFAV